MRIVIIGGGWYGAHTARTLAQQNHDVTVLEAEPHIFGRVSGMFGIRRHAGPHYPRSSKTRESCHTGADEFDSTYPELVVQHEYSIYGNCVTDATGLPSKVTDKEFREVCFESKNCRAIDVALWGFNKAVMPTAYDLNEPSIKVGKALRAAWEKYLSEAGVHVVCNYRVMNITVNSNGKVIVTNGSNPYEADAIVNATSLMAFRPPQPLPFNITIKYQVCLALIYEDLQSTPAPFSFIVMDGDNPCIMPYDDRAEGEEDKNRNYILTHGRWTIMCSRDTPEEAKAVLNNIDSEFILKKVKPLCEKDILRYMPKFAKRFRYVGWQGNILPKIKADTEFRSAVTFGNSDGNIIYIIPGKVTNIGDAARETCAILNKQKILTDKNGYTYVENGILHEALGELKQPVAARNTCNLETYEELCRAPDLPQVIPLPQTLLSNGGGPQSNSTSSPTKYKTGLFNIGMKPVEIPTETQPQDCVNDASLSISLGSNQLYEITSPHRKLSRRLSF